MSVSVEVKSGTYGEGYQSQLLTRPVKIQNGIPAGFIQHEPGPLAKPGPIIFKKCQWIIPLANQFTYRIFAANAMIHTQYKGILLAMIIVYISYRNVCPF